MKTDSLIRCQYKVIHQILFCLLLFGITEASFCQTSADTPTQESPLALRQLVETAIAYDIYNAKCRGLSTSIYSANLNKLLIRKYSLTLAQVIQNVTSQDQREFKETLNTEITKRISELNGCKQAKRSGFLDQLQSKYRDLMQWLEEQP